MGPNLSAVEAAARHLADTIAAGTTSDSGLWSPDVATSLVVKSVPDQRFTLGVAYPALRTDRNVAVDGRRDFIGPAALERCAWNWMAKSARVGLFHGDLLGFPGGANEGHATPAESYIWRGPDWVIKGADGSEQVVMAGDWMLGLLWDPFGWELVKSGAIDGYSPQGKAAIASPSPQILALLRS